ncbi:MAG: GIY-YIG nuclease family protein [Acutalibacteraceae bacterium]
MTALEEKRDKRLERLLHKANALPMLPGVYIMRNRDGEIIYIGKAKKLKNRVSQYFRSQERHLEKVRKMVSNVDDFDYILVDSEFEALILECSLIKQNSPKYNILLKDDKGYHYIHLTNEPWPRLTAEMQLKNDGGENIGPYNSSYMLRQAVDEAKRVFKLPQCGTVFPTG